MPVADPDVPTAAPGGTTPKYAGSSPLVTISGACTRKVACDLPEFGDGPKVTLNFTPKSAMLRVSTVPDVEKSPLMLAAKQFVPPVQTALTCNVARLTAHDAVLLPWAWGPQIERSLPSAFKSCSGSEIAATS